MLSAARLRSFPILAATGVRLQPTAMSLYGELQSIREPMEISVSAPFRRPGVADAGAVGPGIVGVEQVLVGAGDPGAAGDRRNDGGFAADGGFRLDPAVEGGIIKRVRPF